jgi:hypothetical protein
MRSRTLAMIYGFVDYVRDAGFDASEVAFLTLTVPHPRRHTYPGVSACLSDLRSGWSGVSRYFRRYGLEYLRFTEQGAKNGYPHYHLPIVGASEEQLKKLVVRWCSLTGARTDIQKYTVSRDINNLGAYIAKYVSKSLDGPLDLRWMELCYRERVRTVSMSRAARSWISARYSQNSDPFLGLAVYGEPVMSWSLDDTALSPSEGGLAPP